MLASVLFSMKHTVIQMQKSEFMKLLACSSTSRIKRHINIKNHRLMFLSSETKVCFNTSWLWRDGINSILLRISVLADSCSLSCIKAGGQIEIKSKWTMKWLSNLASHLWRLYKQHTIVKLPGCCIYLTGYILSSSAILESFFPSRWICVKEASTCCRCSRKFFAM